LENWFKIEFIFAKDLHITPLELAQMEFYSVEYMIQNYEEYVKHQNEQYKDQEKQQQSQMANVKQQSYKQPDLKIPKMPTVKF
jgi:glucan phosphorylase